jgi:hypothetical protein
MTVEHTTLLVTDNPAMRELARTGEVNFDVRTSLEVLVGRRWEIIMVSEFALNRVRSELGDERAMDWFEHYKTKIGPNGRVLVV